MKLLKIKLNILINSKELKQTLNLTTVLGQQGINIIKFSSNLEPILNVLKYKFPLNIQIKIFQDKSFDIVIKNYNFNFFFKHFIFFKNKYLYFKDYELDFNNKDSNEEIKKINLSEDFINFKYNYFKQRIEPFDIFVFHTVLKHLEKENNNIFNIFFSNKIVLKKILNQIKINYKCGVLN